MASIPATAIHVSRSKIIDGFAQAEATVDCLLRKANLSAKGDFISQKVECLRKAKPWGGWSAERKGKLDKLLEDLSSLLALRNDIVHAPMHIREDGEHTFACFANPNLHCEYSQVTRVLEARRLQSLENKVAKLAKDLDAV